MHDVYNWSWRLASPRTNSCECSSHMRDGCFKETPQSHRVDEACVGRQNKRSVILHNASFDRSPCLTLFRSIIIEHHRGVYIADHQTGGNFSSISDPLHARSVGYLSVSLWYVAPHFSSATEPPLPCEQRRVVLFVMFTIQWCIWENRHIALSRKMINDVTIALSTDKDYRQICPVVTPFYVSPQYCHLESCDHDPSPFVFT